MATTQSIDQVPEEGYSMFDSNNSIAEAVRNRYNLTTADLDDWDEIVAAVLANGSAGDFNATYGPPTFDAAGIDNSDVFRLFPNRVGTCNVRYTFFNNLPSPSTKDNTVIVDICQHQVDEAGSGSTYNCDVDGNPYDGIEGFVTYTVTSADLIKYPDGIKLRVWDTKSGYTAEATKTTTGFFRLDYATGPYFATDTRFFVYIEAIDPTPPTTDTVYGTLSYDGFPSSFSGSSGKVYWNGQSGDFQTSIQSLDMTNTGGGSASLTAYSVPSDISFLVNIGGIQWGAANTGIIYSTTITINFFNASSTGVKGSFVKSIILDVTFQVSNVADEALAVAIFEPAEFTDVNFWVDVNVGTLVEVPI